MSNTVKYILIGVVVLFIAVVIFGMIIKDDYKQPELEPIEYVIDDAKPYGLQHEGLKFWIEIDHTKYKENDYRRVAAEVVSEHEESKKHKEYTVFFVDKSNYLPSHALFRLETKESYRDVDKDSFTFEQVGDYYKDRDTKVEINLKLEQKPTIQWAFVLYF